MKKLLGLAIAALSITPASSYGEASRLPGVIDRGIELPEITPQEIQDRQNSGSVAQPRIDDYAGSNRPLPIVHAIVFNGPTILSQDELSGITQKYLDRPITENDVAQLKTEISNAYSRKGYPLVKVATPTQDLGKGELIINIYEGRVGDVIVQSNGVISDHVPAAFASRLKGQIFDEQSAESVVNDLNEIKNIDANLTLRPGSKPLTTDAVVNITQPSVSEDRNYISADNYGSKLTGKYVGALHLERSNGLGMGEKLSGDVRVSDDNLWGAGLGAKIPTGIMNTYFESGYSYSQNDIGDRLSALDASGKSHVGYVAVSGNVINHDDSKLTLRGGLDMRRHTSFLSNSLESKDNIRRVFGEASYLGLAPSTVYLVNARLSKGVDILGASQAGDKFLSRAQGKPNAVMFEPSAFIRHDLTPNDSLKLYAKAQWANDPLLSSDLFVIGGYGAVRGFEPAQETGEKGVILNLAYEHRFDLNENLYVNVGPWFDWGKVKNELPNTTVDNPLMSGGLGAEFVANVIPAGETSLRLDWAHPIGDYDSPEVEDNSYYFRLEQAFHW